MGNAKAIDIYAGSKNRVLQVDAKAGRAKGNWPIKNESVNKKLYYIFVYLQTEKKIKKCNKPPEYFIASGKEIISKKLIKIWKTRQGITYGCLNKNNKYKERWDKLPPP